MAEPRAPPHWLWHIGDLLLALLLLALSLWLMIAGHFMATCDDMWGGFEWSILVVFILPILYHWTVPVWLGLGVGLGIGLARLRRFGRGRRFFWVVLAGAMLLVLGVAITWGVIEHLEGVRSQCSFGGWR